MSQIPTPPASRHESPITEKNPDSTDLLQSLDSHLERYLDLLDRHQKLQSKLARRLSSGFLSLAHANYTCPPGRRYGADYYDERMKATRKVSLQPSPRDSSSSPNDSEMGVPNTFTIRRITYKCDETGSYEETESHQSADSRADDPTPNTEDSNSTAEEPETEPESTSGPKTKKNPKRFRSFDPVTWYGILVPPSLRNVQKTFAEAVDGAVSELAGVVVEMRTVEGEVEGIRRQLEDNHD